MTASPLQPFGPGIWLAAGGEAQVAGFRYPTRMAVVRLASGGLWVWSPVALTPPLRAAVEALGEVTCLIAPNSLHDLHIGEWRSAYPQARLHAAPGLRGHTPDAILTDVAPPDWAADLDQALMAGNAITTEVVFFHRPSATVLFTDLIQQFPPGWFRGWRALVARLDLMTQIEPAVPRKFRLAFTDRKAARAALARILAWQADKVVMAHGTPVTHGGAAFLARAFAFLAAPPKRPAA